VSFTVLPRFDAPNATAEYAGVHRATVQFAVRDRAHFRIEVQFVSPVIESGTLTVVVNGSTLTSYDARSGLAFRSPMPAHPRAAILDDLLSTLLGRMNRAALDHYQTRRSRCPHFSLCCAIRGLARPLPSTRPSLATTPSWATRSTSSNMDRLR
jgi:hypothetical protein